MKNHYKWLCVIFGRCESHRAYIGFNTEHIVTVLIRNKADRLIDKFESTLLA